MRSITSVTGPTGTVSFTGPTLTSFTLSSGQNLYAQVGCTPCDNSLTFGNFTTALQNDITPPITGVNEFTIYEAVLNAGLPPQSTDTINGTFAQRTFIAPLGMNNTTVFDTSFTNTGLITVPARAIGHGLLVLLAIGGVLAGGKLLEDHKKRHFRAT